jgi:OmpA-OmpF porin, OOP family
MLQRTVLVIAFLTITPAALAAPPPSFYAGAGIGTGIGLDATDLELSDFGIEDDQESWKVYGGIRLGRVFGIEAAWHDFGEIRCCDQIADAGFRLDIQGVSAAAVVSVPIKRLRLFAKAGVLAWEADGEVVTFAGELPFSVDGNDPMAGVGAEFELGEHFAVRAEWEIFQIDQGELDSVSAGVQYRF